MGGCGEPKWGLEGVPKRLRARSLVQGFLATGRLPEDRAKVVQRLSLQRLGPTPGPTRARALVGGSGASRVGAALDE